MARLSEMVAANMTHQGPKCGVAVIRPRLSEADLADLDQLLADPYVPATVLAEQLSALSGVRMKADCIQRHRRGSCTCPR